MLSPIIMVPFTASQVPNRSIATSVSKACEIFIISNSFPSGLLNYVDMYTKSRVPAFIFGIFCAFEDIDTILFLASSNDIPISSDMSAVFNPPNVVSR